jgi:hypothetical protein
MDETIENFIENSEDDLLKNAPIGARIAVSNLRADNLFSYRYENAIKIGDNLYGAHGLNESKFSLEQIKEKLAIITYNDESEEFKSAMSFYEYVRKYVFVAEIETYKINIK